MMPDWLESIDRDGACLVRGVFSSDEAAAIAAGLDRALEGAAGLPAVRRRAAGVVAARNVLDLYPAAALIWRRPPLVELLTEVLGPRFGMVRVLFFDKPPDRTWSLAWHKDLTIAVRDHGLKSRAFAKPTTKGGVPHVEAPRELLDEMLTLRIHLDEVTDENGPLRLIPGSHRSGKEPADSMCEPRAVYSNAGDVLAMRPLVCHGSGASLPGTARHRRVLHLEFCGRPDLPDGYQWHEFLPGSEN